MIKINENIRLIRLAKNLSQQNIADALNLSPGAYSNIESGKAEITFNRLQEIAKILETDVLSIITLDNNVQNKQLANINTIQLYQQMLLQDKELIQSLKEIITELKEKVDFYKELYEECKKQK